MKEHRELQTLIDELERHITYQGKEVDRLREVNRKLLEALKNVTASLVAAHSLLQQGGWAASDKMFLQMLNDYEKSIKTGREAIRARSKHD